MLFMDINNNEDTSDLEIFTNDIIIMDFNFQDNLTK